jgi:hypothetical protein
MYGSLSDVERRILGEAYSSSEAMGNLSVLCDDFGGRFAGSPENEAATEVILGLFEKYGFENPHLEPFNFMGCEVGPSTLRVVEPIKKTIPCLTLPMTAPGGAEADLVYVDELLEMRTGAYVRKAYKTSESRHLIIKAF